MHARPRRLADWEMEITEQTGQIAVVRAPRGRLLEAGARLLRRPPTVRLRLDAMGTFVWQRCDGEHSVSRILEEAAGEFGTPAQALAPRLIQYVRRLYRGRLIALEEPS